MNSKDQKITKTKNHTIRKEKRENDRVPFSRSEQEFFLSNQFATDSIIEKFADDQLQFFNENQDACHVEKYRIMRGVASATYHGWLTRNPYLKRMHAFCVELIALRRKEKVANYDPKFLTHTLHMYCPRHDQANKYKAKLKNIEEEIKNQTLTVVFDDYKESDKIEKPE